MGARPFFGLASLILVAGAILLHFLVLLAGAVNGRPVNFIYFLQADASGIQGANAQTIRWTYWDSSPVDSNGLTIINGVHPAWPFDPATNFHGDTQGVPGEFIGTHYYYYMTRFMFAFNLIALFFMVLSFFTSLLAMCSRIGSYIASMLTAIALVFEILTTVLMTVAFVKGRNVFQQANISATLGQYAFGFMWAATACLIIAMFLFCAGGASGNRERYSSSSRGAFGRKRSTRSRGSFTDSQRPVVEV